MGIFSRTRDIFAANFTELLDRAEDPARMIRMIILEMEETLVEVRASAARSIADRKEMDRALLRLNELQSSWTEKAELALSKGREDLAKQALIERQKAADLAEGLQLELNSIEETLKGYEADIATLQGKLREARARQNAITLSSKLLALHWSGSPGSSTRPPGPGDSSLSMTGTVVQLPDRVRSATTSNRPDISQILMLLTSGAGL